MANLTITTLGFALLIAGCGSEAAVEQTTSSGVETTTTVNEVVDTEPVEHWPVGPEYRAESITTDGEAVAVDILFQSFAKNSVSVIDRGNCAGGGTFGYQLVGDRLTQVTGGAIDDMECESTEAAQRIGRAIDELLFGEPQVIVGADSVELIGERTRLLVTTDDPTGNVPVVPDGVRFNGESSTIDGIDASTVSLISPSFFILSVQLETCVVHTQVGGLQTVEPRDTIVGVPVDECLEPSPSDAAMLDLLVSEPTMTLDGDVLTLTGPSGTVTLRR